MAPFPILVARFLIFSLKIASPRKGDAERDLCRWRVLCFPNAGSAEDMYSREGTGSRRIASPLLVCTARSAQSTALMDCKPELRALLP